MASPREKDAGTRLDEWSPRLLKSRLYQRILVDIIIGALAPGEQLDENVLARRYGGGLAGIREALARLALEGLVVRRARVGTSVAPLDLMGAREAFEARRLVEVHCAGLAAAHASDAEIAAIRATLDDGEAAVEDNDQAAPGGDGRGLPCRGGGGQRQPRPGQDGGDPASPDRALLALCHARTRPADDGIAALNEHRGLADAIASRNVERARAEMLKVLGDFPAEMKRTLESR